MNLKINEIFYSIQGESLLAGKPTAFIRTATCNLRCTWCDTRYSFWQGEVLSIETILKKVASFKPTYVCVTGGEPLGQKGVYPLMEGLLAQGYIVSLETNGSFSVREVPAGVIKVIDIKCPASGESESMAWENLELATGNDQFKFVVEDRADFDWALDVCEKHRLFDRVAVLFSPVSGKLSPQELAKWILDSERPLTLQTQLHKELWGPRTRGV